MKYFIVWNEAKTEGFATTDEQLAYEVRKSSDTNCYTKDGDPSVVAMAFCDRWHEDACTIETVDTALRETPEASSHFIWTHTKSGGEYRVVGTAKLQTDKPLNDMHDVAVYIGYDRQLWVRDQTEFVERFTRGRSEPQPVRLRHAQVTKMCIELSKRFHINLSTGEAASLLREMLEAR